MSLSPIRTTDISEGMWAARWISLAAFPWSPSSSATKTLKAP